MELISRLNNLLEMTLPPDAVRMIEGALMDAKQQGIADQFDYSENQIRRCLGAVPNADGRWVAAVAIEDLISLIKRF